MVPVNEPQIGELEIAYINDCLKTGWISSVGGYLDRFESEWAAYCGRQYGVAVSNGTTALELAVAVLQLPAGSEVILPSFTIVSCLEAVLRCELKPVFVDCDPQTYCMNPTEVESRISSRTSAIMPVHIYGHPVNMEPLLNLAKKHGLRVIEDAAEAHGAEYLGSDGWKKCGSFGDVSTFSFYANKNITTGEGGMVLTDDLSLAEAMRSRRNLAFGAKDRFRHEDRGWNFRMTNIQAAMGCAQLRRIDTILNRKLDMASRYSERLSDLPLQLPINQSWGRSSIWMYSILLDESVPFDALHFAKLLSEKGVQTRPFFLGLHEQPYYLKENLISKTSLPTTENIAKRGLYLPSGQAITDQQITQVIGAVRAIF